MTARYVVTRDGVPISPVFADGDDAYRFLLRFRRTFRFHAYAIRQVSVDQ